MRSSIYFVLFFLFYFLSGHGQDVPFATSTTVVVTPENGTHSADILDPVCTLAPLGVYGGWDLHRVDSTGFFHVRESDGAWYLVDPTGRLFISMGVTSVERGGGITLPDALKAFSINNLGNWSDVTIKNIPLSPRFPFLSGFKNTSAERKDLFDRNILPVFDPEFEGYCDSQAGTLVAPFKDDPWVLGYYTDNELAFHKVILDDFLALPAADPNRIAANQWMIQRSGEGYTVTDADRMEFRGYVAETYASAVNRGLKKYDPNHLNVGCRLHSSAKYDKYILRGIGKHVDVISINFYSRWEPSDADMDLWLAEGGKPFLITEFYTKAEDTGLPNTEGAGWKVYTQQDRAWHFENFTLRLLSHPGSVGWTWFRYIDKDGANKGIISEDYQWYTTLLGSMQKIGKDVYNLRRFLLGQELDLVGDPECSDTTNVTFVVSDRSGHPVSSAAVVLSGELKYTDETGVAAFDTVPKNEDLPFSVEHEWFEKYEGNINLVRNNDTVYIELIPLTYQVTFAVTDGLNIPVEGAFVSLSGYGTMMTDGEGKVTFFDVLPSEYILYSISKEGFRDTMDLLGLFHSDLFLSIVLQRDGNTSSLPSSGKTFAGLVPVQSEDFMMFSPGSDAGEVTVYSLEGILMFRGYVVSECLEIDVSGWSPGLYLYRFFDSDGSSCITGKSILF